MNKRVRWLLGGVALGAGAIVLRAIGRGGVVVGGVTVR